ncbi:autotransporter-associated N-terminal domain-containing protein [Leptotrichia hongkongensis]|uniref:Autotransporter-associated N-terminal domain-containing protein n=1 Tax=Leptotrichia hongkongensis TaxID=554406 RepID=A0ABV4S8E4_9FUSO
MTNNLRQLGKDLRAFAKRCKNVHYNYNLLITFLLTGTIISTKNLFSATKDPSIESQKQSISTSIKDIHQNFKRLRTENNKLMKNSNLELIQLMEQGDHVTKSPWSSWQYGINYYYNDWHGTYKGKGNKIYENEVYLRQKNLSDRLSRYLTDNKSQNSYNMTNLNIVPEYPVTVSISAGIRPKSVNKTETNFVPQAPSGALPPFEPRMVSTPSKPGSPNPTAPTFFNPPSLVFKGKGFSQRPIIGNRTTGSASGFNATTDGGAINGQVSPRYSNAVVMQNYDTYNTTGTTTINMGSTTTWTGDITAHAKPIVARTVAPGSTESVVINGVTKNIPADPFLVYSSPTTEVNHTLTAGQVVSGNIWDTEGQKWDTVNAFISDSRDHDTKINGNYKVIDLGNGEATKIFFSYNPSGVGGKQYGIEDPNHPGTWLWGWSDGSGGAVNRTAEFKGTLDLNGISATNNTNVLVGLEHQLWAKNPNSTFSDDQNEWNNSNSNTTLLNSGTINLSSGNNMVGIMIDVEYSNDPDHIQNKTINTDSSGNGKIVLGANSSNSVGIDFGSYQVGLLQTDVSLGNIEINGKNNYGFRMSNIFDGTNNVYGSGLTVDGNKYYDSVTVNGSNSTITVGGTENVGISIAKNLSASKNTNPINNISALNLLLTGNKVVGFLRNSNYSGNNNGDMILNDTSVNSLNFGDGAKESTLVRSDKYGIILNKTINSTKGSTGNSFAQSSNGGYVTNQGTLSSSLDKFTGMVSSGSNGTNKSKVSNTGTITLTSNSDDLVGLAALNNADVANTGTLKILGTGKNKAGIYNNGTGTATIGQGSDIEITGESSSAVYNNSGTVNISGTNSITANNGSVGIFSSGGTVTSTSGNNLNITVNDTVKKGLAVYAENGANVNLSSAKINVQNGAAGVTAEGAGTSLNLQGATLTYNGDGYAIYANNGGNIDLSNNAAINLYGKATGFEKNTSTVNLTGSTIHIYSDDVTVVNVKDGGTLNTTGLQANVGAMSGAGALSINSSHGFTGYKLAAIDGLTAYNVYNIDKSIAADDNQQNNDSYVFTKNLLVQRAVTNLKAGNNVKAVLSGADMTKIGLSSVVGLDMSSSKNATSNNEAQINLEANTTVTADRSDSGSGGIGLYINYGKVNTDASAIVNVEKEANTINDGAVGIYSVNGSEVNNAGTVNVGGNNSIGILGMGFRENSSGTAVGAEFGTGTIGQGKASVLNSGNLNLDGEDSTGIYMKNNSGATLSDITATNTGTITMSGNGAVGMSGAGATLKNNNIINITGQKAVGIFGNTNSDLSNTGTINIGASATTNPVNIGIFTNDTGTSITNDGTLNIGKNSYGIYGKNITIGTNSKINVGDNGVGIFSNGNSITVNGELNINPNEAVGVFTSGNGAINVTNNASKITIGDGSYGFVLRSGGTPERIQANGGTTGLAPTTFTSNTANVTLGNQAVYVYSADTLGTITNKTAITTTGSNNYGLYAAGNVVNDASANMNLTSGVGNVGIYSIENGTAKNYATIDVGTSDRENKFYSIGMAAGYYNENTKTLEQTGNIENYGTINVNNEYGIGMYAVGNGSKAINYGTINLDGKGTTGMYLDQNAVGINYGIIQTSANPSKTGIIGVAALNNSVIKNYGRIIVAGTGNIGVYTAGNGTHIQETGPNPSQGGAITTGSITASNGATDRRNDEQVPTDKKIAGINIIAPAGATTATIERNGIPVLIDSIDTTNPVPQPQYVTVNSTSLIDLSKLNNGTTNVNLTKASSLGMYVDTSGVNYTKPIEGLQHLNLSNVNLIFGSEVSKYTQNKDIEVGDNILKPFNDVLAPLAQNGLTMSYISGALNWIATATYKPDGTLAKVYMSKIPYTAYAKSGDRNNYNFLDGLEQRYGVEGLNSREKTLFNKLNEIGKGESRIFVQAVDEMKGYQYSNTQQRISNTSNSLDTEFSYLKNEWRNPSKQNNKIKVFGMKDEYNTDTAGIINYTNNAYGVAYVHEDEQIKMGNSSGWYAGVVTNRFKFKDIGHSKENQSMIKAGIFKTMSPRLDHNGALQWTIGGDIFAGINSMTRKYLVLDEIFQAKSDYHSYGAALKTDLGYDIRLSERTHLRPYGALKMEYGRFNDIKEDRGEMRLEVNGNDYFSVKPEVGMEFKYVQPLAVRTNLTVGLKVAYENEIGKLQEKNQARVRYTTAGWYDLANEKENRSGNGKFDLNIGIDNTRFGVTVNGGYDTKGNNVKGGIGFRAIY